MLGRVNHRTQVGDTIVEVLFAVTIFSLIAVGSLSIMNQGLAVAQRALEITLVRQQIDSQADALRFLNGRYIADYGKNGQASSDWNEVIAKNSVRSGQVQDFDTMVADKRCVLPVNTYFTLDLNKMWTPAEAVMKPTTDTATYSQVRYEGDDVRAEGLWIQAVKVDATTPGGVGYYDFHIRACWDSPGQDVPLTIGTIVRLYVPEA